MRDSDVAGVIVVGTGTQTSFSHLYPAGHLPYLSQADEGVVAGGWVVVVVDCVVIGGSAGGSSKGGT